MFQKIRSSNWFITLSNWEYWPWYIANIPVFGMVLWFAVRARNLFFFSAVNPAIETGGVWGESKFDILESIPLRYRPSTLFLKKETSFEKVWLNIQTANLGFPLIAKPNVGERGFLVAKIGSKEELGTYIAENKVDFLLQEFLPGPIELSILHYLPPRASRGETTSICIKNFLGVQGDGSSTIMALMEKKPRAKLQLDRFEQEFPDLLAQVPEQGEQVLLEPIGNHCRGTTFLNGNDLIDEQLMQILDKVMAEMDDIHYGRFDLRCSSVADLKNGNFKVMEFNGIAAEPAHIYDPAIPVWKKYQVIWAHWNIIYRLYRTQQERGKQAMTLKEAMESYHRYITYKKAAAKA